ncbi:Protein of unknown function [Gryllus bimaculatus]|nr:Protein of unknown function [Gryllus bimaculatus]
MLDLRYSSTKRNLNFTSSVVFFLFARRKTSNARLSRPESSDASLLLTNGNRCGLHRASPVSKGAYIPYSVAALIYVSVGGGGGGGEGGSPALADSARVPAAAAARSPRADWQLAVPINPPPPTPSSPPPLPPPADFPVRVRISASASRRDAAGAVTFLGVHGSDNAPPFTGRPAPPAVSRLLRRHVGAAESRLAHAAHGQLKRPSGMGIHQMKSKGLRQ